MYSIVQVTDLAEQEFPEWSFGRIFTGVRKPDVLNIGNLPGREYLHELQIAGRISVTGYDVVDSLVGSFISREDTGWNSYSVETYDGLNCHFGLNELFWLKQNWETFPSFIHDWAKDRRLHGYRDVIRHENRNLYSPCLDCTVNPPHVSWRMLHGHLWVNESGLRE